MFEVRLPHLKRLFRLGNIKDWMRGKCGKVEIIAYLLVCNSKRSRKTRFFVEEE